MGGKSDISRIFLRYSYGHSFFFATDEENILAWILSYQQDLNNYFCIFDARETTGTRINCCVVRDRRKPHAGVCLLLLC